MIALGSRLLARDLPSAGARPDLAGAVLLTGALVLLVFAISKLTEQGLGITGIVSGVGGLLALAPFVVVKRRIAGRGGEPIVRFGRFENRQVRYGNSICLLSAAAVGVVIFLTSLYLQRDVGLSPLQVGLGFAPVTLAIAVGKARAGDAIGGAVGLRGRAWAVFDGLLGYVPVAAFAAPIAPGLGLGTPEMMPRLFGAAVAAAVVLRVGHLWAGLGAGMVA